MKGRRDAGRGAMAALASGGGRFFTSPSSLAHHCLKAAGHASCGVSNAWVTWLNLEQFSAWHNLPLATKANGMDGFDTVRPE